MKITKSFLKILGIAAILTITFTGTTYAQCKDDITIRTLRRDKSAPNFVSVLLTTPKGVSDQQRRTLENQQNWVVFNPDAISTAAAARDANQQQQILRNAVIPVRTAVVQPTIETPVTLIEVILTLESNLVDAANYLVQIKQLASANCLQAPTLLKAVGTGGGGKTPASKTALVKAKDRKDADIYIQGLAEGARKQKTFFSIDALVKRRFRFAPNNFWEPVFDLKTSTNPKADPDSASLGVNYIRTYGIYTRSSPLSSFDFTNGVKLESDTDFKNVNFVYQVRGDLAFRDLSFGIAGQPVDIIPFVGFELGRNLRSPLSEAKNRLIARPFFGASLYFQIFQSNEKVISFETQYTRRFPLKREIFFKTDNDGNFTAIDINTKPRDYVKSSFNFEFTRNFGFSANYEYGQLPPKFTLVDSKFSFGLLFKGKFGKEQP